MARMTYMGNCVVGGILIPCTSMNSGIENTIQFYDHIVGLRDKDYIGDEKKGPETDGDKAGGYKNIQKKIYRYPPSIFKGKLAGPISVNDSGDINIKNIIENAIRGTIIDEIDFIYISAPTGSEPKQGHRVKKAVVESLTININSGDIATFDISIVAKNYELPTFTHKTPSCSKLLTWDKCFVTPKFTFGDIQAFSIDIKNETMPIYVSGSDIPTNSNYFEPIDIRLGMQEVTGTISAYGFNVWKSGNDILKFKLGAKNEWSLNVLYNPTASSATGSSEPYISSTPFVGASDKAVWNS